MHSEAKKRRIDHDSIGSTKSWHGEGESREENIDSYMTRSSDFMHSTRFAGCA
jgi:hypothetical protein